MFGQYFGNHYFGDPYFGPGAGAAPPVVGTIGGSTHTEHHGPAPGSYDDGRSYLPPGQWVRHEPATEDEAREIYEQAKREIPEDLQVGLLPAAFSRLGRPSNALPDSSAVDLAALGANLGALNLLLLALAEARRIMAEHMAEAARFEAKKRKRQRDEEALLMILSRIV